MLLFHYVLYFARRTIILRCVVVESSSKRTVGRSGQSVERERGERREKSEEEEEEEREKEVFYMSRAQPRLVWSMFFSGRDERESEKENERKRKTR